MLLCAICVLLWCRAANLCKDKAVAFHVAVTLCVSEISVLAKSQKSGDVKAHIKSLWPHAQVCFRTMACKCWIGGTVRPVIFSHLSNGPCADQIRQSYPLRQSNPSGLPVKILGLCPPNFLIFLILKATHIAASLFAFVSLAFGLAHEGLFLLAVVCTCRVCDVQHEILGVVSAYGVSSHRKLAARRWR
jgi:hypothetical protein